MHTEDSIRTTFCIRSDRFILLKHHAQMLGTQSGALIVYAVNQFIKRCLNDTVIRSDAIEYQPLSGSGMREHICLSTADYDLFLDAKKVLRLSLSHIIALALDMLFSKEENEDSYPHVPYYKEYIQVDNAVIFVFCWGQNTKRPIVFVPPD